MALDPLTAAKLWLLIRPIRRFKEWRRRKRIETSSELIEVEVEEEPVMVQEIVGLIIRHGLTFAGGAGLLTDNEVAQLTAALATIAGLAWSAYRKWARTK